MGGAGRTGRRARTRRRGGAPLAARTPAWVIAPAVVAIAFLALPLLALLGRANWATMWSDVTAPETLAALWLSVWTALVSTAICAVLGIPLAMLIAGAGPRLAAFLRGVTTIPLLLPPMVGGVALLYLLGRNGWLGTALAGLGVQLPFTTAAVILAQVFVSLPFLALTSESAIRLLDTDLVDAAQTLGANSWQTFVHVVLPIAAPGVLAGLTLSFARAMGEFGATALFAGNAPGVTRTMPLAIYTAFNGAGVGQGTAIALSLLLFAVALIVLVASRSWRPTGALG